MLDAAGNETDTYVKESSVEKAEWDARNAEWEAERSAKKKKKKESAAMMTVVAAAMLRKQLDQKVKQLRQKYNIPEGTLHSDPHVQWQFDREVYDARCHYANGCKNVLNIKVDVGDAPSIVPPLAKASAVAPESVSRSTPATSISTASRSSSRSRNSWGSEIGHAFGELGSFIGNLLMGTLFLFSAPLILWQRIFMEPDVINLHMQRTLPIVILGAWLRFSPAMSEFVVLGALLIGFGMASLIMGAIHLAISRNWEDKTESNGFGLLNVYALVFPVYPNRIWTVVQEAFNILAVVTYIQVAQVEFGEGGETSMQVVLVAILIMSIAYNIYMDRHVARGVLNNRLGF